MSMESLEVALVHIQESISLYEDAAKSLSSDEKFLCTSPVFQAGFLKSVFDYKKDLIDVHLGAENILKEI